MSHPRIRGLIAAPLTPLRADGSLHLEVVATYARWLSNTGVAGAFICGTTGEGLSLSVEERCRVAERWVTAAAQDFQVLVHVGHNSLPECQRLAAHAASIGAAGFACLAPFFFKPDLSGLVRWCEQIAAAAPSLPFYYYHIPSITGVSCRVSDFLKQAAPRIPNLAGVKYTHEDLDDFQQCLEFQDGRFDILFGRDELLASALVLGARGAVGSTYNFAAPLYRAMMQADEHGDHQQAAQLQQVANGMIEILVNSGVHPIVAFKWFIGRIGIDCGPPRLPLAAASSDQIERLELGLRSTGIDRWIKSDRRAAGTPS